MQGYGERPRHRVMQYVIMMSRYEFSQREPLVTDVGVISSRPPTAGLPREPCLTPLTVLTM